MDFALPLFLLFWLVTAVASLGLLAFWIWMLVECLMYEPSEGNDKLVWALVIVLTNWIGALIYLFVRRPERIRLHGQ